VSPRPDALVVGAGIVGAACADALARAGLRVHLIEAAFAGGGATAAGMGHLVVMDDSPAQLALTARSVRLWTQRADELPADCELDACGTLWVASDADEMAHVARKAALYAANGIACETLDAAALAEAEPELRAGLAGGLLVPGDRVLYPTNAARHLIESARRRGALLREGSIVRRVGAREATLSTGEKLEAGFVVNAAGARAPQITPGLPVAPRRGHLLITERAPGFARHQLVELGYLKSAHELSAESVAFNVQPRATGQLLVGSSREFVGFDDAIDRSLLARMLRRACEYLPRLAGLQAVRAWLGFRPATPDKLPLVGAWQDGLYVAAGHEGLGITTALASAELLADLALRRTPALDPAPFDPRRPMPETAHA
jgi:glycine/D-amino acid oxidase-like deaminating enzyme